MHHHGLLICKRTGRTTSLGDVVNDHIILNWLLTTHLHLTSHLLPESLGSPGPDTPEDTARLLVDAVTPAHSWACVRRRFHMSEATRTVQHVCVREGEVIGNRVPEGGRKNIRGDRLHSSTPQIIQCTTNTRRLSLYSVIFYWGQFYVFIWLHCALRNKKKTS